MNLEILKKSRRAPDVGDIFVMRPPDGKYLYGRVIDTNANPLGMGRAILIYVYSPRTDNKRPIPRLTPKLLLLPPMMTNQQPWTRGYFETLETEPLTPHDCLVGHSFFSHNRRAYFDEKGNPLSGAIEPVGVFGLHSYQTIDDAVSDALGIPRAPG